MGDDELVVGGQLGNYLIDSVLGRGGMSVVYRARHARLGMWVALKVLSPQLGSDDAFRERFLREAQMAATVEHPNVIPIHDMGVHEGSLYIVMRYVAGGDLKAMLAASGRLDPTLTLRILRPIALALDAAHARGLVHRDVKPANVLVQRGGENAIEHVYLTDFGIAKSSTALTGLTGTGVFIGTVEYMAPEQMESHEAGPQADVYALAATTYQCLTGQIPFHKELSEGMRPPAGSLGPASTINPALPQALDDVLAKGLARSPADRFATCEALIAACEGAMSAAAASAPAGAVAATELAEAAGAAGAGEPGGEEAPAAAASAGGGHARRWIAVAGVLAAAAIAAVVVLASSSSSSNAGAPSASAGLAPVPDNHVTGLGHMSLRLDGDRAVISLETEGLDNGDSLVHVMHIHGGGKGECPPASAGRLHNGHLAIDTNDGINYYGPPMQSLTTYGDTSVASILVFKRYPTGGSIRYKREITLPANVIHAIRADNAVIVVHGIDYDGSGIYSGVLDRSDLSKSLPATATAPALCGALRGTATATADRPATDSVYTASLQPARLSTAELSECLAYDGEALAADERRSLPTAGRAHA